MNGEEEKITETEGPNAVVEWLTFLLRISNVPD
jgi:hypothetical protein